MYRRRQLRRRQRRGTGYERGWLLFVIRGVRAERRGHDGYVRGQGRWQRWVGGGHRDPWPERAVPAGSGVSAGWCGRRLRWMVHVVIALVVVFSRDTAERMSKREEVLEARDGRPFCLDVDRLERASRFVELGIAELRSAGE